MDGCESFLGYHGIGTLVRIALCPPVLFIVGCLVCAMIPDAQQNLDRQNLE